MDIGIGSKVYIYDENHRVYFDDNGKKTLSPIYKKYFISVEVVGETSRSWLVDSRFNPIKCPKKNPFSHGIIYSQEMMENMVWINSNRWRIIESIRRLEDADRLRKIAEIIDATPQFTEAV